MSNWTNEEEDCWYDGNAIDYGGVIVIIVLACCMVLLPLSFLLMAVL